MKNLQFSTEVSEALHAGQAVVALESTIISHGMPYPQNVETAQQVEDIIRRNGATPATIAILDGTVCIGLSKDKLQRLGQLGGKCRKCSRRDIASVVAEGGNGATTVAATMYLAHLAGIRVFVTGGVGGVHRGVQETWDVSADLIELGRTPVAVVCAGVKSILDIPKTLEYLETQGVTVASLGQAEFPSFFTPNSGCKAPLSLSNPLECAKLIKSADEMKLSNGQLFAVPIPAAESASGAEIERAVHRALKECSERRISGRDITPFLLNRVNELTQGRSLNANIALVKHNAAVGATIACHLLKLHAIPRAPSVTAARDNKQHNPDVVVVGGSALDLLAHAGLGGETKPMVVGSSNPGVVRRSWGGVGRNVAEVLHRLDVDVQLISAVGDDAPGRGLVRHLRELGMRAEGVSLKSGASTAVYMGVLSDDGGLHVAIADMAVLNTIDAHMLAKFEPKFKSARVVVVDGNLSAQALRFVTDVCFTHAVPVVFEPISVPKAPGCLPILPLLHAITPNEEELTAIVRALHPSHDVDSMSLEEQVRVVLDSGLKNCIVTLGAKGCMLGSKLPSGEVTVSTYGAHRVDEVVNTTGAGDSLLGGVCFGVLQGLSLPRCLQLGMHLAAQTIQSPHAVSHRICRESLAPHIKLHSHL